MRLGLFPSALSDERFLAQWENAPLIEGIKCINVNLIIIIHMMMIIICMVIIIIHMIFII